MLFSSASLFYKQCHFRQFNAFFPGFSVLFLFTAALIDIKKKKQLFLILILSLSLLMVFILNLKGFPLLANWLLFSIFIVYIMVFFRRYKSLSFEVKVLFALIFIYSIIFFKFSSLVPGTNFSIYGLLVYFIPAFSNFRFLFRGMMVLVPIFTALAAYGLSKMVDIKGRKKYLILTSLILLAIIENGYISTRNGKFNFEPQKYRKIEKESDRIILELPIYGRRGILKNNRYTINTIFHNNYYVNGRVSVRAFKDNFLVEKKISNKNFPDEHRLRWLLKNYSVDYLIFNWKSEIFKEKEKEKIIKRVEKLKRWCEILDSSPEFLVVRLKENFPVKRINRRYSLFHIKRRKMVLDFSEPYEGKIWGFYSGDAGKVAKIERPDPLRAKIEFPVINPGSNGTPIEIHFETPVKLKDIRLEKK
ncbi:MAG: hypothetical protein KAT34_10895 [Candidatus Aminicenantes bacterium]|nr:hypothetical protein [Candidatus Aminicenantes bacterium]